MRFESRKAGKVKAILEKDDVALFQDYKEMLDSGSWRATWKGEGSGVLINQCPHQIDLVQWIVGKMPKTVRGFCQYGKWHDIEVEDEVTAFFEYENGATGVFITTTGGAPGTNRLEISGTKGKLLCENDELVYYKNVIDNSMSYGIINKK